MKARHGAAYQREAAILAFTEDVVRLLQWRKLRRVDLARRLGKSKPYITEVLRGANVTLGTAAKFAAALRAKLVVRLEDR